MRVMVDTNIILDCLLDRKPFSQAAIMLFAKIEQGELEAYIGGTTVTTVHYLVAKALGTQAAHLAVEQLLQIFVIAPITRAVLTSALSISFSDYEDAVLHEAAMSVNVEAIITRDAKGFHKSAIPIYSPHEFAVSLA